MDWGERGWGGGEGIREKREEGERGMVMECVFLNF